VLKRDFRRIDPRQAPAPDKTACCKKLRQIR
jgi:hypothetical protein